jgi:hypothetical protein
VHGKTHNVIDLKSLWQWLAETVRALAVALDPGEMEER